MRVLVNLTYVYISRLYHFAQTVTSVAKLQWPVYILAVIHPPPAMGEGSRGAMGLIRLTSISGGLMLSGIICNLQEYVTAALMKNNLQVSK